MQTQSLTLEELQAKIAALQANSAIQNVNIARELEFLKAHARYAAHLEFYHKYQEWDWIVRQQYMDFVKPLAYEWPIPDDSHGYAFELVNYTPWFAGQINDPNFVVTPDCMKPYDIRGARQTHLTEFVKVENMEQCKLTQKIVDAFNCSRLSLQMVCKGEVSALVAKSWCGEMASHAILTASLTLMVLITKVTRSISNKV
jgi:hypothetical protein